jgi:hypothetical protein
MENKICETWWGFEDAGGRVDEKDDLMMIVNGRVRKGK